ncbi:MAG TPA: hypothetical protein PLL78_02950 [Fimbriimonadaceae bacterium]|nr:hypothetical protein [Fimbriimonadaceae bacterium]HRJ95619.1 hypothetical protein [Fimbriimonadaceae bacterium]
MELEKALAGQLHAGLAMLASSIERCPSDLWSAPNPPAAVEARPDNPDWNGVERPFWRIAFHAVYFTHLYIGQGEGAFVEPPAALEVRRRPDFEAMWHAPWSLEPYELPPGAEPISRGSLLEYAAFVDGLVDVTLAGLELGSGESGFPWYPGVSKLSHELLNLRHLQGHVGQLSELLMLRGIDIDWV